MTRLLFILAFLILIGCSGTKEIGKVNGSSSNKILDNLSKQVSETPGNYEAYFELAQYYSEKKNIEKALFYADSALTINPDYQEARYLKATLNFNSYNTTAAYKDFLILLSLDNSKVWFEKIAESTGLKYFPKQLTRGNYDNTHPSYEPSGNRIVFQSNRDHNWDISIADPSSGEIIQITNNPLHDESPIYSDQSTILFTRQQSASENKRDIFSINIEDRTEKPVIVHPADDWNPAPTSNGKSLLFVSDRGVDGNYRSKIFNYDNQSNQVHSILMQDYDYSFPCVQSNKDQFLFTANNDANYALFNARLDGSNITRLTSHNMDFGAPKYSPDGNKVVFFSRVDRNYDIYELDLRTESLKRLTSDKAKDLSPSYSPDGNTIVYYSNRSGRYQIYKIDLNRPIGLEELKEQMRFVVASVND